MAGASPESSKSVPPKWRQTFDSIEREVTPRLDSIIRSEQFAVATGLAAQMQRRIAKQAARNTRRVLHLFNLPAGTDVTRLLNEIGQLKAQVRSLSSQIEAHADAGTDRISGEVTTHATSTRPKRAPRPRKT